MKMRYKKGTSLFLALLIFYSSFHPLSVYALTGGPAQPEFTSFTPYEMKSLVDHFTGDFKYNIPLLEVDGYPLNLAYDSNVSQETEASWVGLGWTLNPGAINRSVRGIPDDFSGNGDKIVSKNNMRDRNTYSVNLKLKGELVGIPILGKGTKQKKPKQNKNGKKPQMSLGLVYDNYAGLTFKFGLPLSQNFNVGKVPCNLKANVEVSSNGGLTITPKLSVLAHRSKETEKSKGKDYCATLGLRYNNESGLSDMQIGYDSKKKLNNGGTREGGNTANLGLGTQTFMPSISTETRSTDLSLEINAGAEVFWFDGLGSLTGGFSTERMATKEKVNQAYGYLYHERANPHAKNVTIDINREGDAAISKKLPALPTATHTYDVYQVSAQGIGGAFRPYRAEATAIYEEFSENHSDGHRVSAEVAGGNLFGLGLSYAGNFMYNSSGPWRTKADGSAGLIDEIYPEKSEPIDAYNSFAAAVPVQNDLNKEHVAFKRGGELSESDANYFERYQSSGSLNVAYDNNRNFSNDFEFYVANGQKARQGLPPNRRFTRMKRAQPMEIYTAKEAANHGFEKKIKYVSDFDNLTGEATMDSLTREGDYRKAHHISEIKVTREDGFRFYYGIPVYQFEKIESIMNTGSAVSAANFNSKLIGYSSTERSTGNVSGIDYYYNETSTSAHATAYLLTAMVSDDYVDTKQDGPTADDYGTYVKFNYTRPFDKNNSYKWRTPVSKDRFVANFNPGNYSENEDNKAMVTYGAREVYYLKTITTKNYVVEFYTSPRLDAYGVDGLDSAVTSSRALHRLDSIRMYSLTDRMINKQAAVPIKSVYFVYDYHLCKDAPNAATGKLTLRKVYFTYRNSKKGELNPYTFYYDYSDSHHPYPVAINNNPDYEEGAQDMWGNRANKKNISEVNADAFTNSEFPFVDSVAADTNASAWLMTAIKLPNGGTIQVDYESDDYAFVQDERTMEMYTLEGFANSRDGSIEPKLFENHIPKNYAFLTVPAGLTNAEFQRTCLNGLRGKEVYYRCYVDITGRDQYEFVSGFVVLKNGGVIEDGGPNNGKAWVELDQVPIEIPKMPLPTNPIAKQAWQNARLYLNRLLNPPIHSLDDFVDNIKNLKNHIRKIESMLVSYNASLHDMGYGKKVKPHRSMIRLFSPNCFKKGGGARVSRLIMKDKWDEMAGTHHKAGEYGYKYTYTTNNPALGVISSGVAEWEPGQGAEVNPHKQPMTYNKKRVLAPSDNLYREKPLGEMLYPNPGVGYSEVTVEEITANPNSKGVGKKVYEFYTAREFPVQVSFNQPDHSPHNNLIAKLLQIFKVTMKTKTYATQGLSLQFNTMHGVPKSEFTYGVGSSPPLISSVTYHYKHDVLYTSKYGYPVCILKNRCDVLRSNGTVEQNVLLGMEVDLTTDFREFRAANETISLDPNLDTSFPILPVPIPFITAWPGFSLDRSIVRTVNTLKIIMRHPILEKVVKTDLGSTLTEESLVFDPLTGNPLIKSFQNQFNDRWFQTTLPAHWAYPEMGPAYQNTGFTVSNIDIQGDNSFVNSSLVPGDIVAEENTTTYWVVKENSKKYLVDKDGNKRTSDLANAKVYHSGYKNQLNEMVQSVTTKAFPVVNGKLVLNSFSKVIDASGMSFSREGLQACACQAAQTTDNPYLNGTLTSFKADKSYKLLVSRNYSDRSTRKVNPREDGAYASFSPLWVKNSLGWVLNQGKWVAESDITLRNSNGIDVESVNPINQYQSMRYTYNQKIPKLMAGNARFRQVLYEHFEDGNENCLDQVIYLPSYIDKTKAHSGRSSVKVNANSQATYQIDILCPNINLNDSLQ